MTEQISPEVLTAALWLSLHRDECPNPIVHLFASASRSLRWRRLLRLNKGVFLPDRSTREDQCNER